MSRGRALIRHYLCSHLSGIINTILIGGPEVVLNSLDNVSLDILLLFEGDR